MGVVHEALHVALGRRVAVKTLLAEAGHDPQLAARFEREARAASAIGHPHIVDVFDLGRTPEGLLFMAMELLDGQSLASLLEKTPCLPLPLAINLIGQILSGLGAAHKNGIVHRDLKPENIFIVNAEDRPNFIKIVDFGISKMLLRATPGQSGGGKSNGTVVGTIMGTPLYMSPEQTLGQVARIDHRTDIYSAGVVLYEMLCGRTPFEDESHAQVFANILDGRYFLPRGLRPEIPPAVEDAIVHALDRDFEKRFPTAAAMREAITGRNADLTPAPELVSASFGGPLPLGRKQAAGREVGDAPPIVLQEEPEASPRASGTHAWSGAVAQDRFAPLTDNQVVPLLADERGRSSAARLSAETSIELAGRSRAPASSSHGVMARERLLSPRNRSRMMKAVGLLVLLIAARMAYSYLRPTRMQNGQDTSVRHAQPCRVTLAVEPTEASVQVDHIPVTGEDLLLDEGTPHVIQLAAPGRISRRLSFEARPGVELSLRLGRVLPLPSPSDPEPLPAELAAGYPDDPFVREEINHAFAKLDRYGQCLALLGDSDGDGHRGGSRAGPSGAEVGRCIQLLDEASVLAPDMSGLRAAGGAYLQGATSGQGALHKLLAAFRSEFLAARAAWQMEELSREEADDGQTAAWHMRRVALAAQAWLRQGRASSTALSAAARGVADRRARLVEYHHAFVQFAEHSPQVMARTSGADAFTRAAQTVVALARGQAGRRQDAAAALTACRQLLAAFNALVVE
jgi:hypothetical protein